MLIPIQQAIRDEVIKNLLSAHKRIADSGSASEIIRLSKFILRVVNHEGDKLIDLLKPGCNTISELMSRAGIHESMVAEALCISDELVSKWVSGQDVPDAKQCHELAALLNVSLKEIYLALISV